MGIVKKSILFYGGGFLSLAFMAFMLATGIKAILLIWLM